MTRTPRPAWPEPTEEGYAPDPTEFNVSISCDTCGPLHAIVDVKHERFIEHDARRCLRFGHAITVRRA